MARYGAVVEGGPMTQVRLQKSDHDRLALGVCGGLAEYFNLDSVVVRLAFVVLGLAGGLGLAIYLALSAFLPRATPGDFDAARMWRPDIDSGDAPRPPVIRSKAALERYQVSASYRELASGRNTIALVLVVIGSAGLLANFGAFGWFDWSRFWPLAFVGIGFALVAVRLRGE
jgi:phage shock protein PspC (stress-responsive transcriptional regulator)